MSRFPELRPVLTSDPEPDPTAVSAGELLSRLRASRRIIPLGAAAGLVVATAAWIFLPRTYASETTLLPTSSTPAAIPGGLLSVAGKLGIKLPTTSTPESHLYPTILKSERIIRNALGTRIDPAKPAEGTLMDRIVDRSVPEERRMEDAVDRVRHEVLRVSLDPETGIVRVGVVMDDPFVAQRTASIFVGELDGYLSAERNVRARRNLEFIESRLEDAGVKLAESEARLSEFREANRQISNSPPLLLEAERRHRDVRVNEEVFLELTREREVARIDAEKATPIIEVLDPPTVRHLPESPRFPILAGVGVLAGILLGTLVAAVLEGPRFQSGSVLSSMRLLWGGRA